MSYSPNPAAAGSPIPVGGTPQYQYVSPQPIDQQQFQYAQQPTGQQQATTLQQPYYPAQTPAPVFQQAGAPVPTEFKEQPYAAEAQPAEPVVIQGERRGLLGKMHQFEMCCGFVPLHTGAMIISALMFIFYGWCGLALLTVSTYSGSGVYYALTMVIGALYVLVAVVSAYGFMGVYNQNVTYVNNFIRFFLVGSIIWAILQIVQMGILVAYYSNACAGLDAYGISCGFSWAPWVFTFLIGLGFQYYFCCCLVSYQRVLLASVGDVEGAQDIGGKNIEMH
ncbi:hypothetical protein BGX29_011947 [Mortierella sp. GBA35]|nr:hypothetical protein BGX23_001964 [Mortierella sp. AD031]KAF9105562.1 hypothetical protein BGX29_011947 [Mortierella sp. GBA35]KAG0214408.1 hypothetical protein BGX33_002192 [Mortierella sp. NVP41]